MTDLPEQRPVERFLHAEAKLLDTGRFADWLALFAADGLYWVPSTPGQTDPLGVPSIMYEDRGILAMRVQRLLEARALVMTPMPRTLHLLGNIVVSADAAGIQAESALVLVEYGSAGKILYAGRCQHRLLRHGDTFQIAQKRVDLLDCDGRHGAITVPF